MRDIGFQVRLNVSYDEAVQRATAALKEEGFGVLTTIDVKETFKQKLNLDFRRYVILGAFIMIAFSALVIGGAVWLVITLARGNTATISQPAAGQTPLDILRARYAKGEITKEQFEEMKRALGA